MAESYERYSNYILFEQNKYLLVTHITIQRDSVRIELGGRVEEILLFLVTKDSRLLLP